LPIKRRFPIKEKPIITPSQGSTSDVEQYDNSLEPTVIVTPLSTRNLNSLTQRSISSIDPIDSDSNKRRASIDFNEKQLERMCIIFSSL
jgi:hypothetical protein